MNEKKFLLSVYFELFALQFVFIFIPLDQAFNHAGGALASVLRGMEYLGPLLLGYYSGSLIDKTDPFKFSMVSYLSCLLSLLLLFISYSHQNLPVIMVSLFGVSMSSYLIGNFRNSTIPKLFGRHDFAAINSRILMGSSVGAVLVPLLAGYAISNEAGVYSLGLACVAMFFSSMLILVVVKKIEDKKSNFVGNESKATKFTLLQALSYIREDKNLRFVVFSIGANNAVAAVFTVNLVIYLVKGGVVSEGWSGIYITCSSMSAAIIAFFHQKLNYRHGTRLKVVSCSLAAMGGGLLLFQVSTQEYFLAAVSALMGCCGFLIVVNGWTIRQECLPVSIIGTVSGTTSMLFKISSMLGLSYALLVTEFLGYRFFPLLMAIIPLAASLACFNQSRVFRKSKNSSI